MNCFLQYRNLFKYKGPGDCQGLCKTGRDDKIRTCDPLHPMQVRYRAALRPEFYSVGCKGKEKIPLFPMVPLNFFLPNHFKIFGLNIALIKLLQISSIV